MGKFRWHADYFDGASEDCARRTIIEAANASDAKKIAKSRIGAYGRVELRRVGTAQPIHLVQARTTRILPRAKFFRIAADHFRAILLADRGAERPSKLT